MTAVEPQVRHDARCPFGADDITPCSCRDAWGYAPFPAFAAIETDERCPVCERPAEFRVGPDDVACTSCVGFVAAFVLATTDGFAPLVVETLAVPR